MINVDMPNRIKFTIDYDKIINTKTNFTTGNDHICEINYDRMITQDVIFNKLKHARSLGFCTLISIYNAFPDIFTDINELVYFIKIQLRNRTNYGNFKEMTDALNNWKDNIGNLLYEEQNLNNAYNTFCNNINLNKPVVISYQFKPTYSNYNFGQHAVTLYGYNDNFIFYHENSEDDYLFTSLALSIYEYYKNRIITNEDNICYDKIMQLINAKTNDELYDIAKTIVGYNEYYNHRRSLNKKFLTDETYFYDINRMILYKMDIEKYIPSSSDNNYSKQIDFSKLTEKLLNIKINF